MKSKHWTNGEWTISAYNSGTPRVEVSQGQGAHEICALIATSEKEIYDHQKKDERFFVILPNEVMEKSREILRAVR